MFGRAANTFLLRRCVQQQYMFTANRDWTLNLTPITERTSELLHESMECTSSSDSLAAKLMGVEADLKHMMQQSLVQELWEGVESSSIPAVAQTSPPDEKDGPILRILAFIQSLAALATAPSLRCSEELQGLSGQGALRLLCGYGPFMTCGGRTSSVLRSHMEKRVALSESSDLGSVSSSVEGISVHVALGLLSAVRAALELNPSDEQLLILRSLIRPAMVRANTLRWVDICDLITCLAQCASQCASFRSDAGIMSFEDMNDCVSLAGVVAQRLAVVVAPHHVAKKNFSQSSKFSFSLAEKKAREERELKQKKQEEESLARDALTMVELAELATAFGALRFRDDTFLPKSGTTTTEGQPNQSMIGALQNLWTHIALATVHLISSEMQMSPPCDADGTLQVSFRLKEIQSICFALDFTGQESAYDSVMNCLLSNGIVEEYIVGPNSARRHALKHRSHAVAGDDAVAGGDADKQ